jgi:hypothetical protein
MQDTRARRRLRAASGALALFGLCATVVVGAAIGSAAGRARADAALLSEARADAGPGLNAAYTQAVGPFMDRAGTFGLRVGIQVGHWKQDEIPPELGRLRDSTGAEAGPFHEVDVNLAIARELATLLAGAGIATDVLPATIPPGYLADAFVAIHADGAARSDARGWKAATAWRASPASNLLLDAVSANYGAITGLPEDRYGITYGMKGYYAFSGQRVRYALSPFTPCIIVETGFVTVASDRAVIVAQPRLIARAIATGILRYLGRRPAPTTPAGRVAYLPPSYPAAVVASAESVLRLRPGDDEPAVKTLVEGTTVMQMQLRKGWTEVVVRGDFRSFGWLPAKDLRPAG